jgi:predicted nuclease of predicted toxin-antitoxin system
VAPGSSDEEVLDRAIEDARVLITFDKDFGELAFRTGLPSSCGVVLFRISAPSASHVARLAASVLGGRADWSGHFSVVEDGRVRMTPLPKTGRASAQAGW